MVRVKAFESHTDTTLVFTLTPNSHFRLFSVVVMLSYLYEGS